MMANGHEDQLDFKPDHEDETFETPRTCHRRLSPWPTLTQAWRVPMP